MLSYLRWIRETANSQYKIIPRTNIFLLTSLTKNYMLIEYGTSVSNSQHSMLDLRNDNSVLIYNIMQEIISKTSVFILW